MGTHLSYSQKQDLKSLKESTTQIKIYFHYDDTNLKTSFTYFKILNKSKILLFEL